MVKPTNYNEEYFYVLKADIKSNCVKLYHGIKIGMSKNEVLSGLGLNHLQCDTLIVIGGDSYSKLEIVFNNKLLSKILLLDNDIIE